MPEDKVVYIFTMKVMDETADNFIFYLFCFYNAVHSIIDFPSFGVVQCNKIRFVIHHAFVAVVSMQRVRRRSDCQRTYCILTHIMHM